ncbi:substrate-binding domain-containing protein [Clostridiaceae bacterium NSJ-31]|uniref:Substrate-binding domain-containing protein n=1 Tax=Ligaoa zhengdingensis TaxID=2763658 RepID=A0A926DW81_9FIRM|nr:substrate-binding domain-containing protein [Ligaoa zhengdingensis]MBC8546415.1 substrate-binding domain-containing protein [Ligaoa zhengdingensis]
MKKLLALILSGSLALTLAACGGRPSAENSEPSSRGEESSSSVELPTYRIQAVLPKDAPYIGQLENSFHQAVNDESVTVNMEYVYVSEGNETASLQKIDPTSCDGVIASPLNGESSLAALSRVSDRGVPVALIDTQLEKNDFAIVCSASDQYALGEAVGKAAKEYIETELAGKATVAVLQHSAKDLTESTLRLNGFLDQLKEMKDVSLVRDIEAATPKEMEESLGSYLDEAKDDAATVFFCTNAEASAAVHNALVKAGRADKAAVFGVEADDAVAQIMQEEGNTIQMVAATNYWQMGYDALVSLLEAAQNPQAGHEAAAADTLEPVVLRAGEAEAIADYASKLAQE